MKTLSGFLECDRGSASMEAVIWIPVFLTMIISVTDVSFLFTTHTQMWHAARETARSMSLGEITTATQAQEYATARLPGHATFTVSPQYDFDSNHVAVTIDVGYGDASVFGIFENLLPLDMGSTVIMRKETS